MDRKKINAVLVILSMVYGAVVGTLAAVGSSAMILVAIIGGALLGISWASVGYLAAQQKRS
ncbi:hypothetical protein FKR81_19045 [Lentzea tibetensis]|uniref:Uncharacterized protein n=1 Tax=Lentzea tibetensis TaxID=2591470 RepID=A0A563ESM7_9PSEU|nr:hypothetical protein [Lentzea tibetensis]TWP50707.1 hypothetical protein FKR81_19045 [Lentzea tibetensis]